jgi:integrase
MAKTVRDRKLDSSAARAKLAISGKPYYRAIDPKLHLGYRKGKGGGKWVLRRYIGNERYIVETIGTADDHSPPDGTEILDFYQAQRRARERDSCARGGSAAHAPLTVAGVLEAYFERLEHEGSRSILDAKKRAALHILPSLGDIRVAELTRERTGKWLKHVSESPRHVRGKSGEKCRPLAAPTSEEDRRRRKATANRTLTILRAALNQAFREGKIDSDSAWRAVKPFREVERVRLRYFSRDEVRRFINASSSAFRDLAHAALFTGCRYGELCQMRVADFNAEAGTLFVARSKSGRARHVILTDEGCRFFLQLVSGRVGSALMLARSDGSAWGPSHQARPMAEACRGAGIAAAGFHILRHTAASHLVMSGVPLNVVAVNLGHADVRMTTRHYAHLAPSYVADAIRKFAPTFGTVEESIIHPIARPRV